MPSRPEPASACRICAAGAATVPSFLPDADQGLERFPTVVCPDCGSWRLEPAPADEVLARYYGRAYYSSGQTKFRLLQGLVDRDARNRARRLRAAMPGQGPWRAVDIGCGRAQLLVALAALGVDGTGIERTELGPARPHPRVEIRIAPPETVAIDDASVDAVVIWHVLEHLRDPLAILDRIERWLRPGGVLWLAVPNASSWQARWFPRDWFHNDAPRHLHGFGHEALRALLLRHGYTIERESTFDLLQNTYGFVQSVLNRLFPARPNRLYQLLRSAQPWSSGPALLAWLAAAGALWPFALLESALSAASGNGATSIFLVRKAGGTATTGPN